MLTTQYSLHTSGKDSVGHKGRLHHPTPSGKCKNIHKTTQNWSYTSRWWRWWWCNTRRWWRRGWWRWRGRPSSCRPATATDNWSLSSTECRILEIRMNAVKGWLKTLYVDCRYLWLQQDRRKREWERKIWCLLPRQITPTIWLYCLE